MAGSNREGTMDSEKKTEHDLGADAAAVDTARSAEAADAAPHVGSSTIEMKPSRIKDGIEFYETGLGYEDCQCARCGSSCGFVDCDNCGGEGEIEDDDWQCEGEYYQCDWCRGSGGHWHCLSGREWCQNNPMPGRETQPVTGLERDDE